MSRPAESSRALVTALVKRLPPSQPGLFNPYRDACEHDVVASAAVQRRRRLARHLDCEPRLILVGEAIGYQGGRYSGIAFTSERLMLEGAIPRIRLDHRLSDRRLPFSEPSASIVWGTLYELDVAEDTILWNAVHCHPHRPDKLWSNRTPTSAEIALGASSLKYLIEYFPAAVPVAVGRKSAELISKVLNRPIDAVRHPAYGGASEFRQGLRQILQRQK